MVVLEIVPVQIALDLVVKILVEEKRVLLEGIVGVVADQHLEVAQVYLVLLPALSLFLGLIDLLLFRLVRSRRLLAPLPLPALFALLASLRLILCALLV